MNDAPAKLAALRAKYGGARAQDVHDPEFRKVADHLFKGDTRKQPYSDVATLCAAPHRPDGSLAGLDVALIGIPMDLGVTNRPGARFGPRAVRGIERIGPYNHVLRVAPMAALKVADVGDVPFRSRYSLEQSIEDIEKYYAGVAAAGVIPLGV